jgi:patatin-like phospholipase/acyl hydrolase
MDKPIHEIFDLITGTSTGAILGGCLAVGCKAHDILDAYVGSGKKLFHKRSLLNPVNWFRETYDRQPFMDMLASFVGKKYMSNCLTKLIVTGFGCCAQKTHFIKSTADKDRATYLATAIAWSALSAVKYFGPIKVPSYSWEQRKPDMEFYHKMGEVFQDGGQGINNCTLGYDIFEILANNWEEDVFILSLGTGSYYKDHTYKKESKIGRIHQIIDFFSQARNEAPDNFIDGALFISKKRPNFKFCRIDVEIPKKMDKLDAVKYIPELVSYGVKATEKIPWDLLK